MHEARVKRDATARVDVGVVWGAPLGQLVDTWFALPELGEVGGLTAAGGDAVLLEASSPDGAATFLVRAEGAVAPEYRLELILHHVEVTGPLVASIRYPTASGGEQTLLVPVVKGQFGPAASLVRLPGLNVDAASTRWSAQVPAPVVPTTSWEPTTVVTSIRAALNEATRDAWRQVRELVGDELRAVIDGELS
ncbi:hypothetical protein [Streptomyces puniciscabiei]|uniref:hypothetical protein n=1 Tax=Streptomyces puniciscabiei TaxID=164348 RepID=UPI00332165A5